MRSGSGSMSIHRPGVSTRLRPPAEASAAEPVLEWQSGYRRKRRTLSTRLPGSPSVSWCSSLGNGVHLAESLPQGNGLAPTHTDLPGATWWFRFNPSREAFDIDLLE